MLLLRQTLEGPGKFVSLIETNIVCKFCRKEITFILHTYEYDVFLFSDIFDTT
jgi:hypothetical protein